MLKKGKNFFVWLIWDFSGLRFFYEKLRPPLARKPGQRPPSSFILWMIGMACVYFAIFGIASQRYENRVNVIENRAAVVMSQSSTQAFKNAFRGVARIQRMTCPVEPKLFEPLTVFRSFFLEETYNDIVRLLKQVVENRKESLSNVDLSNARLDRADFTRSILKDAILIGTNFSGCLLKEAYLKGADLRGADLSDAILREAYLGFANLAGASLRNADLSDADLTEATGLDTEQLCEAKSLSDIKLPLPLEADVKERCPELLERNLKES